MADTISRRRDLGHLGLELEGMGHHPGHHPPAILPRATVHNPATPLNTSNSNNNPHTRVQVDKRQDMDRHSNSMDMAGHRRTLLEAHQGIRQLARILRHRVATSDVRGHTRGSTSLNLSLVFGLFLFFLSKFDF